MNHPWTRRLVGGAAALAAAITLSACGDDDDDDAAAGADVSAFCGSIVAFDAVGEPDVDFETATPEELVAAIKETAGKYRPLVADALRTAPEELQDEIKTFERLTNEASETGDGSVFESPESAQADRVVDDYVLAECGYEEIEAVATDFEFAGIPETVPAGIVGLTLKNEGEELHEIAVMRLNDGVDLTADELLALPEEEARSKVTEVGGEFAMIGQSSTSFLDLKPGKYIVSCFIPVGTTGPDVQADGPPHFVEGMKGEFTVS